MEKAQEKAPSKKLKEKIHACVSPFQKLGVAVKDALEQGRVEGFTDKETGKMIREEMLRAGITRQTVNNYLPSSAKAKPRGNPSGRPSEPKFSKKFLLNEAAVQPEPPQPEWILSEEDVIVTDAIEEQKRVNAVRNTLVPESNVVAIQHVTSSEDVLKLQSATTALDPEEDRYDIEHLEKYSRGTLEKIVKWQYKRLENFRTQRIHFQEGYNEETSWKSKYMGLKAAYEKATGREWVD
jgi:hypothetical protein